MTPSDSQLPGRGQTPALDQTNQTVPLTVDEVKNIIQQARVGVTDP